MKFNCFGVSLNQMEAMRLLFIVAFVLCHVVYQSLATYMLNKHSTIDLHALSHKHICVCICVYTCACANDVCSAQNQIFKKSFPTFFNLNY